MKRVEEDETVTDPETGEEYKQNVEKFVEIEIDDKILMIPARVDALPYAIYAIN